MGRPESHGIAGVEIRIESDDAGFSDELASFCEAGAPAAPAALLEARVESDGEGEGRLTLIGDDLGDAAAFVLSMASPTLPVVPGLPDPRGEAVALRQPSDWLFVFGRDACHFRKVPRWRRILAHFVFLRALRLRRDALYFHAASVSVRGRGVLLVGPKGSGKTTLALALGARGHGVLGEETAAYVPASGELLPMRRPAHIKPGPRSRAIERLVQDGRFALDEDGRFRVPLERLVGGAAAARLHAVSFLRGFAEAPRVTPLDAGRPELASLQPLAPSVRDGAPRRLFDMAALLSEARCYEVRLADADATAEALEAVVLTR